MIEIISLSTIVVLFLYSYVFKNISFIAIVAVVFLSLQMGAEPVLIWSAFYLLGILRFLKPSMGED